MRPLSGVSKTFFLSMLVLLVRAPSLSTVLEETGQDTRTVHLWFNFANGSRLIRSKSETGASLNMQTKLCHGRQEYLAMVNL